MVVEQVEFIDYPYRQSYDAMAFTCFPQIAVRSGRLFSVKEYKLVGVIHMHPRYLGLSEIDKNTFDAVNPFISVFGVFNGEGLAMYSRPRGSPLTMTLRAK